MEETNMKRMILLALIVAGGVGPDASWSSLPASAQEYRAGGLLISRPWAKPSLAGVNTGAVFVTIRNEAQEPDRLIAAKGDLAAKIELHTHVQENGVVRMRRLEGGIDLPAGKTVELKPGGLHIMLIDLKTPLQEGARPALTLVFEKAGELPIEVMVTKEPAAHGQGSPASKMP
jgi:copper(I)-binding protein